MKLLEAIQGAGENWFRPVGSKGFAYYIEDGILHRSSSFGVDSNLICMPLVFLMGEWEIVTPEQVLAERKS